MDMLNYLRVNLKRLCSEINDDFYGKSDCKSIQPKTAENLPSGYLT